jgi:hypothetical protein
MRIERPSTHILNRRRRRVARVEHERRLHLHVKFIGRNGGIKWSFRGQYASRGRTFRVRHLRNRRWIRV